MADLTQPHRAPPEPRHSARLAKQQQQNTSPEIMLRRILHSRWRRFRVHYKVDGLPRRRVDIAFPKRKVAVFVDGCFWHSCPVHRTMPLANREWWAWKLGANITRDADTNARLEELGWRVVRIWEHEPASQAADRIESVLEP